MDIADGQVSQKFHSVNLFSLCLLQFIFSSALCQLEMHLFVCIG